MSQIDASNANSQKYDPAEEQRKEHVHCAKLRCLAEVLGKKEYVDKLDAERTAKAINSAFDKITY